MLIDLTFLWGALALTYLVFAKVIPWAGRLLAIYLIHSARLDVYRAVGEIPQLRNTVLFRDVDHLLAYSLHMARDMSREDGWRYRAHTSKGRDDTAGSWREGQYELELSEVGDALQSRHLGAILRAVYIADFALSWKLASSNIVTVLVVPPLAFAAVVISLSRKRLAKSTAVLSRTIASVAEPDEAASPGARAKFLLLMPAPVGL